MPKSEIKKDLRQALSLIFTTQTKELFNLLVLFCLKNVSKPICAIEVLNQKSRKI